MQIRKMTENDLPKVLELQRELAFQDWNEKQFLSEIRASYACCVVCESLRTTDGSVPDGIPNGTLLGYAIFHLVGPDSELLSIATRESEQRKGIGSQLLNAGLAQLTTDDHCFLEVRNSNAKARAFYEKHGFKLYSVRKRYYADGEDAALYIFSNKSALEGGRD